MTIKDKAGQAKEDYEYIYENYGDVYDFTGSGMEDSQLNALLANPSWTTVFNCYLERITAAIDYGVDEGGDRPAPLDIESDPKFVEIAERYNLSGNQYWM